MFSITSDFFPLSWGLKFMFQITITAFLKYLFSDVNSLPSLKRLKTVVMLHQKLSFFTMML